MKSPFWKEVEDEEKREREIAEEEAAFIVEQYKNLKEHPGWQIYVKQIQEWMDLADDMYGNAGLEDEKPFKLGYLKGTYDALKGVKRFIYRTIEEEEEG